MNDAYYNMDDATRQACEDNMADQAERWLEIMEKAKVEMKCGDCGAVLSFDEKKWIIYYDNPKRCQPCEWEKQETEMEVFYK